MTMSTTQNRHPSNRLSRGEVTSFEEAMRVYREQMAYENGLTEKLSQEYNQPITPEDRKLMHRLCVSGTKAAQALSIYYRHLKTAKDATVAELQAMGDDEFTAFADALESGDYSGLAI
jgi:hypothetical protein